MGAYETTRWTIWTEREKEAPRVGVGQKSFDQTILHLRVRGDRRIKYHPGGDAPILSRVLNARPRKARV